MSLSSEILDLKSKTSDWTLECDKSLFAIVEKFSENTLNRINDLNTKMKDINFETQKTFCNTNHLFSEIYNMANQKFIEMVTSQLERILLIFIKIFFNRVQNLLNHRKLLIQLKRIK